jgi:hypothetical protein
VEVPPQQDGRDGQGHEKSPNWRFIGWIEDEAEHFGKLVSNYRAVGIVPPASRKPASQ